MDSGSLPRVGPPVTDRFTLCAYSATPTSPPCTAAARVHVRVTVAGQQVGLATCDEHLDVARAAGVPVDEHPFEPGYCSRADALWSAMGCAVEVTDLTLDDSGASGPTEGEGR